MEKQDCNRRFYSHYIFYIKCKYADLLSSLHISFLSLNNLKDLILENEEYYTDNGVSVSHIDVIHNKKPIKMIQNRRLYELRRYLYVAKYNHLLSTKIPFLKKKLEAYATLMTIPYHLYRKIQLDSNSVKIKQIVDGDCVSLGNHIGTFFINFLEGERITYRTVNWGATMKLKRELLDRNISLMSRNNPGGKPYFIFYDNDIVYYFKWRKRINNQFTKNRNIHYYKFRPTTLKDISFDEYKDCPREIVMKHSRLGGVQKLTYNIRNVDNYKQKLYSYVKNKNKRTRS